MDSNLSSNIICQLNEISTKSGILMKFEKHPRYPTGTLLRFGNNTYEAVEKSVKESRIKTSKRAMDDYNNKKTDYTEAESSSLDYISKVYEISTKLRKNVHTEYLTVIKQLNIKHFMCRVTFNSITCEYVAESKRKAKEYAFKSLYEKINEENISSPTDSPSNELSSSGDYNEDSDENNYLTRDYQEELYQKGLESNILIYLATGTGKTYIAVLLIKKYLCYKIDANKDNKWIVFLVPSTALVVQQSDYIRLHINCKVGEFCGEYSKSAWLPISWKQELDKYEVLVMTPEIFRQLLHHNLINANNISLIIFDECHHAGNAGHPYNVIMTLYFTHKHITESGTRIIGLTASPIINSKFKYITISDEITEKIEELEKVYNAKFTTACKYENSLKSRFTKPNVSVIAYKKNECDNTLMKNIKECIHEFKCNIEEYCKEISRKTPPTSPLYEDIVNEKNGGEIIRVQIKADKIEKYCVRSLSNCIEILEELGIFGLFVHIKEVIKIINNILDNIIYEYFKKEIKKLSEYFMLLNEYIEVKVNEILSNISTKSIENICQSWLFSPKLKSLMVLLTKHFPRENSSTQKDNNAIVFVRKRGTSSILHLIVSELCKIEINDENMFSRFSTNFVVGISSTHSLKNLLSGITDINLKKIKSRIEAFQNGNYNVLFCTNVLEEGIDVQSCNVVIRFDPFSHIKSFIQSRGRIRSKKSYFYVIEESSLALKVKSMINNFFQAEKETESIINKRCNDEFEQNNSLFDLCQELTIEEQTLLTPSSKMDMRTAVSYLHRFCDQYSVGSEYKVYPRYFYEKSGSKFCCNTKLPVETGIDEIVSSDYLENKKQAQQHCSLRAIKMLFDSGLIDENFLPLKVFQNIKGIRNKEKNVSKSSSSKQDLDNTYNPPENFYIRKFPSYFIEGEGHYKYEVYAVSYSDFRICKSKSSILSKLIPHIYDEDFVILVPKLFTNISFPLASSIISLQMKVMHLNTIELVQGTQYYSVVTMFNKYIYENIIKVIPCCCEWNIDKSHYRLYFALFKDDKIDYEKMSEYIKFQEMINSNESLDEYKLLSTEISENVSIMKNYSNDKNIHHVVATNEVNVISKIYGTEKTFQEYFDEKYGIILERDEVMMSCYCFTTNLNYHLKVGECRQSGGGVIHIPSSCVVKHILSTSMLFKLNTIPSIVKRIIDFTQVIEWCVGRVELSLLNEINSTTMDSYVHGITIKKYDSNFSDDVDKFENYYVTLEKYISSKNNEEATIPFSSIFTAFTRVSCGESVNYDRLELLGDAYLRYIVTLIILAKFQNMGENQLTRKRDCLTSNKYFNEIGIKLGFQHLINSKKTLIGKNWCPPNCFVANENFDGNEFETLLHQYLIPKSIADVFESLVGCIFYESNFEYIYAFLKSIGYCNDILSMDTFEELIKCVTEMKFTYSDLKDINYNIDAVEDILKYKFTNRQIVAQALTHQSSINDREKRSYEKLEFIGDAVLGFMISFYLYKSHEYWNYSTLTPFAVTHILHALVNNKILALLSVKSGIIKCLEYQSYELHVSLNKFVSAVNNLTECSSVYEVPFLGIISTPKVVKECGVTAYSVNVFNIPKTASDVFESLMAAVFIDSGCNLVITSRIFLPFFESYIVDYFGTFPVNPKMYVTENYTNLYNQIVKVDSCHYKTILNEPDTDVEFIGYGSSIDDAYNGACYCLMKYKKNCD